MLVFGSRHWAEYEPIKVVLETCFKASHIGDEVLVNGACPSGADEIAAHIGLRLGFRVESYPPDWSAYGKAAGPIRNFQMAKSGLDVAYGFKQDFGGWKTTGGTEHMHKACIEHGVPVRVFNSYADPWFDDPDESLLKDFMSDVPGWRP